MCWCKGIDLTVVKVPLHQVFLRSGFIQGMFKTGSSPSFSYLSKVCRSCLGNDLAGDKVLSA